MPPISSVVFLQQFYDVLKKLLQQIRFLVKTKKTVSNIFLFEANAFQYFWTIFDDFKHNLNTKLILIINLITKILGIKQERQQENIE